MEFKAPGDLSQDKNMMALGVIRRRMTREERIKAKEREEARKAGKLEPEVDDEGKEINPHVPKFIADAPWYMSDDTGGKASLKHQKYQKHPTPFCLMANGEPNSVFVDTGKLDTICMGWIHRSGMRVVYELVQPQPNTARAPVQTVVP